jgi:CheY-like chemotaxis protein
MRILVVEDDATARDLVRWQLLEFGHEVDTAADAHEALACLKRQHYEVIVTDLQMPDMDGIALWELARSLGHGGQWLLMTGAHGHPRLEEAGALRVLLKPFRSADLVCMIEEVQAAGVASTQGGREELSDTGVRLKNPRELPLRTRGSRT